MCAIVVHCNLWQLFDLRSSLTRPQLNISRARLDELQARLEDHDQWLGRIYNSTTDGRSIVMGHLENVHARGEDLASRLTRVESRIESKTNETDERTDSPGFTRNFWWLVGSTVLLVLLAILLLIFLILACRRCWLKLAAIEWRVNGNAPYQVY